MGLQFVETVDPTSSAATGTLQPAPTVALKLTLSGTTAAGQTLALSDIADSLTLRRDGSPFSNESFEFWHEISQLWFGDVDEPTGNAAKSERVVAYLWLYQPEIPQAVDVQPDNLRYNLRFNTSTLGTRFGSNSVTCKIEQMIVKPGELPELYTPYCLQDDISFAGAGQDSQVVDEPNVTRLFFDDPSSVVTDLKLAVDGEEQVENNDLQGVNDQARLFNNVPDGASAPPFVEYSTIKQLGQTSLFSDRTAYQLTTSGSGVVGVTRMRIGDVADRQRIRAALS